jgi:hypothetical protein
MDLVLKMEMTHVKLIVIIDMRAGSSSIPVFVKDMAFFVLVKKRAFFFQKKKKEKKCKDKSVLLPRTGS